MIDRGLPDSSAEERDLWHETTKDLPLNDLRELLRLRTLFGRLSPPFGQNHPAPSRTPLMVPEPTAIKTGPRSRTPIDEPRRSEKELDSERVLSESLATIESARALTVENIANAQTIGYKRSLISFDSRPEAADPDSATPGPAGPSSNETMETRLRWTHSIREITPGRIEKTGRCLDLAIEGDGFFCVINSQDKRLAYTRRGRFTTNADGTLVLDAVGGEWRLEPQIMIPLMTSQVEVSADGHMRGWDARTRSFKPLGDIQTVCLLSADRFMDVGGVFFVPSPPMAADIQSPGAPGHGLVRQKCLEQSNVDVKQELAVLARLAGQVQALNEASRLLDRGVVDRPVGPLDGFSPASRTPFPLGR